MYISQITPPVCWIVLTKQTYVASISVGSGPVGRESPVQYKINSHELV